jgi:hypothetical protein
MSRYETQEITSMGRPKVHGSGADRQKAYRARRKAEKDARPKETHLQRFRRKLVDLAAEAEMFGVDPIEVEVALEAMADHYRMYVYLRSTGDPEAEWRYDCLRTQGEYSGPMCNSFEKTVEQAKAKRATWESWEERERRLGQPDPDDDGDPVERLQGLLTGRP